MEGDTYININGFLAEWTKGKKNLQAMKLDMQFLEHHSCSGRGCCRSGYDEASLDKLYGC
jgi:hypothetical protein